MEKIRKDTKLRVRNKGGKAGKAKVGELEKQSITRTIIKSLKGIRWMGQYIFFFEK